MDISSSSFFPKKGELINNMKEGKKWNQDRSCEGMSENLKIIKVC